MLCYVMMIGVVIFSTFVYMIERGEVCRCFIRYNGIVVQHIEELILTDLLMLSGLTGIW